MAERRLHGNDSVRLDRPGVKYRVEQGSVALFSVERRDDETWGARSHVLNVSTGGVFTGMLAHNRLMLLAVPIGQTVLCEGVEVATEEAAHWYHALAQAAGIEPPADTQALDAFYATALEGLAEAARAQRLRARQRAMQQVDGNSDALTTSVRLLQGVLSSDSILAIPEGEPLTEAMYAVGQASNININMAPVDSDPFSDPVEQVANASHVRVRPVMLRGNWWREDCGPLLGFQRLAESQQDDDGEIELRPIALLPTTPGRYELYDPVDNTRRLVDAREAEAFEPEAYMLYRSFPDGPVDTINLLRFAFAGRGRDARFILLCGLAATALGMATPIVTAWLVDVALPDGNLSFVWQLGGALVAAGIGHALYSLTSGLLAVRMETRADADTQAAVWDRLLRLHMSFFRRFTVGDLEQRVSAVSEIRATLSGATFRSLLGGILAIFNLGLLIYYIPSLATIAVITALATAVVTLGASVAGMRLQREAMQLQGELSGTMFQLIQGVAKLRIAAAEERGFLHWARRYAELQSVSLDSKQIRDTVRIINLWVASGGVVLLFWFATQLMASQQGVNRLGSGVFLAFYSAYGAFQAGLSDVSNLSAHLLHVKVLRERAQPILDAIPEVTDRKASPGKLTGALALDKVCFRYRTNGPLVLENVTIHAKPGDRIALVGPSGSGKSTIMRLLLGFETPESGVVRIDGQDTRGVNMHDVRRQLGVVLQNGRISAGSLYDNVACGRLMPLRQAERALGLAGMADDLARMPMGMHTVVSEGGSNLSGGQRQRLIIARALALKPALLLFDEATSALDNRTQAIVTKSLESLKITQVIIAHRLSTIRTADRIYVLKAGRVIEEGSFAELVARDGFFAQLMRRQAS